MDDDTKPGLTLRSLVSGDEAGCIIGRGGDMINSIRDESKAKVKVEATRNGGGSSDRVITVEGPTDAIFKAYSLICKTLEQKNERGSRGGNKSRSRTPENSSLLLNLLVPASQCGALIGKEGSKIKDMRESTGADIHISADPMPDSTEREVRVRGSREEVTQGIFHICALLLENPPKGQTKLYRPDNRVPERERDMRVWDREYERADHRGSYRGSRREELPPPRYSGYSGGGGAPMNAFDAILEFARRHDGGRSRDYGRGGGGGDRETSYEMVVPNENIGSVIGRKGQKINEIRQMSGAKINILETGGSKSNSRQRPAETDRERVIEICGSHEAVALAKSLIQIAIDIGDEKGRGSGPNRHHDDRRGGGMTGSYRDRSRSRDRNSRYDDRRRW